jgi:hypothetical protein
MAFGIETAMQMRKQPTHQTKQTMRKHIAERRTTRDGREVIYETNPWANVDVIVPAYFNSKAGEVSLKIRARIQEAFETQGFGTWDDNAPKTVDWKGHDQPMVGLPGVDGLKDTVRITARRPNPWAVIHHVHWPNEPHPYAQWSDGKPMTYQELQILHEFGHTVFDVNFPPRSIINLVWEKYGHEFRTDITTAAIQGAGAGWAPVREGGIRPR